MCTGCNSLASPHNEAETELNACCSLEVQLFVMQDAIPPPTPQTQLGSVLPNTSARQFHPSMLYTALARTHMLSQPRLASLMQACMQMLVLA